MFEHCSALTTVPSNLLPATTLAQSCYYGMFNGCTALTTAPSTLPATTLAQSCYGEMFDGCTALTTAPVLPATTLITDCYKLIFYGCSSLNYIKALFLTAPSTNYTQNWVKNVASSGTFVYATGAQYDPESYRGTSGVPQNWTVQRNTD